MKHEYDDMNAPWYIVFIVVPLLLIFGIHWTIVDAQTIGESANGCSQLGMPMSGTVDLTDVLLESYIVDRDSQRWQELDAIFNSGGFSLYYDRQGSESGFYNINGNWAVIDRVVVGYRVWSGKNWTIGTDGQLHSPTCYLIIPKTYEQYFMNYPQCWYPTRCE